LLLVKNVSVEGRLTSIYVNGEGIVECMGCDVKDGEVVDVKGRLASVPFVNAHSHLGYALTLDYSKLNETGTLLEAVGLVREEVIPKLSQSDVEERLSKIFKILFVNGVFKVRTHEPLLGDLVFKVLKSRDNPLVDVQVVAFPTPRFFYQDNEEKVRKALEEGAEVVGLIPHSERTAEEGYKSVKLAVDLAVEYNKLVDGHVDETDDPNSRFSEALASEALRRGIGQRVTISHMTASHSYDNWYFHKLLLLLKESGVSVVSNPVVSLHLQGRYDGYPKRRGIARIREMMRAGINVALGSDNVLDPIYPLGDFNMLRVLQEAYLVDHFTAVDLVKEGEELMKLITHNGYKAMSINPPKIMEGERAEFVVLQSRSLLDSIRVPLPPFLVVRGRNYAVNDVSLKLNGEEVGDEVLNLWR
jgi:cytosine deaminase